MEFFEYISIEKHKIEEPPFLAFMKYIASDELINKFNAFCENICLLLTGFQQLPERVQIAAKKWAEYGWVPCLPDYNVNDILSTIYYPKSQEDADKEMMKKIDEETLNKLFVELRKCVAKYEHNIITLEDAVKCFENGLYTGCSLCLFALIDSCFIKGQPKPTNGRRKTAKGAVTEVLDSKKSILFVSAYVVERMISNLYSNSKDFDEKLERISLRNFVSHGMNVYNLNQIDCLKLFVLLYNVYMLFKIGVFHWDDE